MGDCADRTDSRCTSRRTGRPGLIVVNGIVVHLRFGDRHTARRERPIDIAIRGLASAIERQGHSTARFTGSIAAATAMLGVVATLDGVGQQNISITFREA